jgi:hypothetical protein
VEGENTLRLSRGIEGRFGPDAGVVFDKAGNLYGARTDGGMVDQLAPPAKQGDPWTESVLYTSSQARLRATGQVRQAGW